MLLGSDQKNRSNNIDVRYEGKKEHRDRTKDVSVNY